MAPSSLASGVARSLAFAKAKTQYRAARPQSVVVMKPIAVVLMEAVSATLARRQSLAPDGVIVLHRRFNLSIKEINKLYSYKAPSFLFLYVDTGEYYTRMGQM